MYFCVPVFLRFVYSDLYNELMITVRSLRAELLSLLYWYIAISAILLYCYLCYIAILLSLLYCYLCYIELMITVRSLRAELLSLLRREKRFV